MDLDLELEDMTMDDVVQIDCLHCVLKQAVIRWVASRDGELNNETAEYIVTSVANTLGELVAFAIEPKSAIPAALKDVQKMVAKATRRVIKDFEKEEARNHCATSGTVH